MHAYNREVLRRDLAGGMTSRVALAGRTRRVELGGGYVVAELPAPRSFFGKSLRELALRQEHGVEVLIVRRRVALESEPEVHLPTSDERIREGTCWCSPGPSPRSSASRRSSAVPSAPRTREARRVQHRPLRRLRRGIRKGLRERRLVGRRAVLHRGTPCTRSAPLRPSAAASRGARPSWPTSRRSWTGSTAASRTRELEALEGPRENGDEVWIKGVATYRAEGVPEFRLVLEETLRFDGDRICHLADAYDPEMERAFFDYLDAYGERLGIRLD